MIIIKTKSVASGALTLLSAVSVLVYIVIFPGKSGHSAENAVEVCIHCVIPSLFCYIVLTKIIVSSGASFFISKPFGKIFSAITGLPPFCAGVYMMSFLSGFPAGAVGAAELYKSGHITKDDAQRLCGISDNTGPALPIILIGGSMMNSMRAGAVIYFVQILASLTVCIMLRKKRESGNYPDYYPKMHSDTFRAITDSVSTSVKSAAQMCAYIILFTVVGDAISFIPKIGRYTLYLRPFIEIVSGCTGIINGFNTTSFIISSAAVSFGGLCVHMQAAGACAEHRISFKYHFMFKILQSITAAALTALIAVIFQNHLI